MIATSGDRAFCLGEPSCLAAGVFATWRRRANSLVPVALFLSAFAIVIGSCVESANLGPYTTWYNHRLRARAEQVGLVGKPEVEVEKLMGWANSDYDLGTYKLLPNGDTERTSITGHTYDYYPYPWIPFSKFQVHCHNGVVSSLEEFDD
ncbi:MAG: hypothetical protein QM723_34410 [Myxococcaceae bacterium]